jgi:hypothetical protein
MTMLQRVAAMVLPLAKVLVVLGWGEGARPRGASGRGSGQVGYAHPFAPEKDFSCDARAPLNKYYLMNRNETQLNTQYSLAGLFDICGG